MSISPLLVRSDHPTSQAGHAIFRHVAGWRGRSHRRMSGAVRPRGVEIRGSVVHVRTLRATTTWHRGEVRFSCPRRPERSGWSGPLQCLLVTPVGGAPVVLDCEAFEHETFIDLVRHLRNFEAIGDAAHDPWVTLHLDAGLGSELFDQPFPHRPDLGR